LSATNLKLGLAGLAPTGHFFLTRLLYDCQLASKTYYILIQDSFPTICMFDVPVRCEIRLMFRQSHLRRLTAVGTSAKHEPPTSGHKRAGQYSLCTTSRFHQRRPTNYPDSHLPTNPTSTYTVAKMGRVRTKTVKKSAKVIIERYYPKLSLDFETNKRICDEVRMRTMES
jgi:hypothetical protein